MCVPRTSTAVALWSGKADGVGTRGLPSGFTTMATLSVPKASSYLVLSSFRIKHDGAANSFVAAQLGYPGGTTQTRMVIENYDATSGFNNMGGSVSHSFARGAVATK